MCMVLESYLDFVNLIIKTKNMICSNLHSKLIKRCGHLYTSFHTSMPHGFLFFLSSRISTTLVKRHNPSTFNNHDTKLLH
jgi:hypothetical protein